MFRASGSGVLPEMNRHATVFVVEHGNQLQTGAERFEVLAQR